MNEETDVISIVRRALGRAAPLEGAPTPPAIDEPITRLVHSEIGLTDLFAQMARKNHMNVEIVALDELAPRVVALCRSSGLRRIALSAEGMVEKLKLHERLEGARRWTEMSLDELYDFDASVTDVAGAVAETGSLVTRETPQHGRALSLVPPIHIAIVEPKQIVADLVDLFEAGACDNAVIITGPSKTADIEMNLVTGVHGPKTVHVFVVS